MNARTMMNTLKKVEGPSRYTISPGPLSLRVGDQDAIAIKLLEWIEEQKPLATLGETIAILHAAMWWETFFAAIDWKASDEKEPTA